MDKSTQEKLCEAIRKHNDEQENEQDKVKLHEVLMEIGNMDNKQLERAASDIKQKFESRDRQK